MRGVGADLQDERGEGRRHRLCGHARGPPGAVGVEEGGRVQTVVLQVVVLEVALYQGVCGEWSAWRDGAAKKDHLVRESLSTCERSAGDVRECLGHCFIFGRGAVGRRASVRLLMLSVSKGAMGSMSIGTYQASLPLPSVPRG